ncbi:MAG: hypothetical protein JXK07_00420 [Spirochaetes bacterium]|nr:hypothetical protein [Spirochaetota bacterium]MBN2772112.1 hypothetical protein [Spirochaetota bacterium]
MDLGKVKKSILLIIIGIMVLLEGTLLSISDLIDYNYPLSSVLNLVSPIFARIAKAFIIISGISLIIAGAVSSRINRKSHNS